MFQEFFYLLRQYGLDVSITEWLTLQEALSRGLHGSSISGFYNLCRSVLCKSESEYDTFQRAFLDFFRGVFFHADGTPRTEAADAMFDDGAAPMPRNPRRIQNTGAHITEEMKNWSLKDREQPVPRDAAPPKEGDTYAGPQSDVPFSVVSGLQPNAIQLGGKPRRRLDLRAPKWDFKDFREDNVLSIRQFQMAFRRLCLYSDQFGREDELDIKRTIHDTCQKAGILQVRYKKPRRNTIKVLLLIDCGGTMTPHHQLCSRLFQAVSRSNRFKDLKIYYFHNCIDEYLYTNPTLRLKYEVSAEKVFRKCDKDYKVILVGDGTMDINELINAPAVTTPNNKGFSGEDWLNYIRSRYRYTVWLTPILRPKDTFIGLWRESYDIIDNLFDMYPLTVAGLDQAMKKLIVRT